MAHLQIAADAAGAQPRCNMVQVLCYTGKAFATCWRPGNIAASIVTCCVNAAPFCAIRFIRGVA